MKFDHEFADLWGWLVDGQEEEDEDEEDYLPHSISAPILVGIQCRHCQCLFGILEDYSGPALRFLDTLNVT
jgi:hypothetical protein